MATKNITLKLVDFRPFKDSPRFHNQTDLFYIENVTNSIEYTPGTFINDRSVKSAIHCGINVSIRATKNSDHE